MPPHLGVATGDEYTVGVLMLPSVLMGLSLCAPGVYNDAPKGSIAVTVTSLRSDGGRIIALLYDSSQGFPTKPGRARVAHKATITDRAARLRFVGVAPGTYAISILHDENDNGKLDTNLIGIPKEGVGASNNAKGKMGPPKYADAKFRVAADEVVQVIEIQYVL